MNKIKRALLRPTSGRWFRWIWTVVVFVGVSANLWSGFRGAIVGSVGFMWMLSAVCVAYLVWAWSRDLVKWIKEDDEHDRHASVVRRGRGALGDDGIIPVVPSSEAISPFHYAMMRAMENESGVSIYCDDEGVWRDGETDEPLPVQGEADDDSSR